MSLAILPLLLAEPDGIDLELALPP